MTTVQQVPNIVGVGGPIKGEKNQKISTGRQPDQTKYQRFAPSYIPRYVLWWPRRTGIFSRHVGSHSGNSSTGLGHLRVCMCISHPIACPTSYLAVLRHAVRLVLRPGSLGVTGLPVKPETQATRRGPALHSEGGGRVGEGVRWNTQKEKCGFQLSRQDMLYNASASSNPSIIQPNILSCQKNPINV